MPFPKSSEPNSPKQPKAPHETGAIAAWGLILGALVGLGLGALFQQTLLGGFFVAGVGWFVGALIERSRL